MVTLCPNCKHKFDVPQEYIGKQIKCPKCKTSYKFIAPEELCENCGRIIGNLEQACVFQGRIVCNECDKKLRQEKQLVVRQNTSDVIPVEAKVANKANIPSAIGPTNIFIAGDTRIKDGIPHCQLCGSTMNKRTISKVNAAGIAAALLCFAAGVWITVAGFFCGGPFVGIPLCICALFMGGKRQRVWKCRNCGAAAERA